MMYISVGSICVLALSYIIPFMLNICKLKIKNFMFGVIACIFFSPMYIVVFTAYSICNIHDISWGSRPAGNAKDERPAKIIAFERKRTALYQNYRSNTLLIWLTVNCISGFMVAQSFRSTNESKFIILGPRGLLTMLAISLSGVIAIRLVLSTIYKIWSWFMNHMVKQYKCGLEGTNFPEIEVGEQSPIRTQSHH